LNTDEPYRERSYRGVVTPPGLDCYEVKEAESDLFVCTAGDLSERARLSLASHRRELEAYIRSHPLFARSFTPVPAVTGAPAIVRAMAAAAELFGVGPMAAVAGAVADFVGTDLLAHSPEVIVENGGDIFMAGGGERLAMVFAGRGSARLGIRFHDTPAGVGLCTSSAGVGPSVSLGAADAVTVLARTAAVADAAATALANRVRSPSGIEPALEEASRHPCVMGAVVVVGDAVGVWGGLEVT